MDDSGNNSTEIDSLLDQLKQNNSLMKEVPKVVDPLRKENAETFVVEKAGQLVNETIDLLRELKLNLNAASSTDPDSISALASLTSAAASSIDLLNKLVIADKKNTTTIRAKELEVEGRKQLADEGPIKLLITREELIKNLLTTVTEKTKMIDVESSSS